MADATATHRFTHSQRAEYPCFARWAAITAGVLVACVALWLSSDMEIMAVDSPLDDELFLRKAESTVWFGDEPYSKYIMFKEPTYSLFVAAAYRVRMPLRFAHEIFYLAAAAALAGALTYRQTRPWVGLAVFTAIAIFPIHFTNFQRAGHSSFYISLVVATVAAFLWQLKRRFERFFLLRWSISGLVLGLLLNTRQEKPLAVLLVAPIILAGLVFELRQAHRYKPLLSWFTQWCPPIAYAILISLAISFGNYIRWGVFAVSDLQAPNFKAAYRALLSIQPDRPISYVPITRAMLAKAYAVSPTAEKLEAFLDKEAEPQARHWNYVQDVPPGEFSGGWFVTSLRDAVESVGEYQSGPSTEAFYGAMVAELNDAARAGNLKTRSLPPGASWVIHPYPETYERRLFQSWRSLWHHAWSNVWQFGPSPANGFASPEVETLFDRIATRRSVSTSEYRNTTRNFLWERFNDVMEPLLAGGFLIAAAVLMARRHQLGLSLYTLPALCFGGYGFAGFAVFTIIDASTIQARDYLFPSILALTITAVWLVAEGLRLLLSRTQPSKRNGPIFRPRSGLAVLTGSAALVLSGALFAQWVYAWKSPVDFTEEVGRLEVVDAKHIAGWARRKELPCETVEVEILIDGAVAKTVSADQSRQELIENRIGSGRHGFKIATPKLLLDGMPHAIDVRIKGTNYRLADTPRVITLPPDGSAPRP